MAATLKMIENSQDKVWKYFAGDSSLYSGECLEFFQKTDLIKRENGLNIRGISELNGKEFLKDYNASEIKFTDLKIPPAMNIFGDNILIFSISSKPIGILIISKEISSQYHKLWDSLWKTAKK